MNQKEQINTEFIVEKTGKGSRIDWVLEANQKRDLSN